MTGWRVHDDVGADRTVHVWPESDAIAHDLTGRCICGPAVEEQPSGNVLVTHHSLDAREQSER